MLSAAHARLARRAECALNEKRIVARAGPEDAQPLLARPGSTAAELAATATAVAWVLGLELLAAR